MRHWWDCTEFTGPLLAGFSPSFYAAHGHTHRHTNTDTHTANPVVMKSPLLAEEFVWAMWSLIKYLATQQTELSLIPVTMMKSWREEKTVGWMRDVQGPPNRKKAHKTEKKPHSLVVLGPHLLTLFSHAQTQHPWELWCSAEVIIVIRTVHTKETHKHTHSFFKLSSLIRHEIKTRTDFHQRRNALWSAYRAHVCG